MDIWCFGLQNTFPFKIFDWIHNAEEVVLDETRKEENPNNYSLVDAWVTAKKIKKGLSELIGSVLTLTNNEIKGIVKVIRSLQNRRILSKGTTRKVNNQKGGFLNFLRPLMTAGLPSMKNVLHF